MCGKNTIKAVISYKDLVVLMSNRFNFRKHALWYYNYAKKHTAYVFRFSNIFKPGTRVSY